MATDYSIPWEPLDITGGAKLLMGALGQRRADQRSKDYLAMEREAAAQNAKIKSSAEARATAEFADRQKQEDLKRKIEAAGQIPMLMRAARNTSLGPDVASQMGSPYGISFAQKPSDTHVNPDLFGAANNAYGNVANDALAKPTAHPTLGPGEEGPEEDPEAEAQRFEPQEEAPEGRDVVAEESARLAAAKPGLQMSMGGKTFDVPTAEQKTGFGDEYDALFNALMDQGEKPDAALKLVASQYKSDRNQKAIGDRVADQIASRESQNEKYRLDVDTRLSENEKNRENARVVAGIGARSRVAAAAPGIKQEGVNDRLYGLLERRAKAVRDTTQFSKLVQGDKTVRGLMLNIANGAVPLQHADAQIQLARYFRQAQPTEGEMHMLYNNLGGTQDKWNQFIARLESGDLSPEQLRQLQIASKAVKRENDTDKTRFAAVARKMLGPGSGLDLIPDQAQNYYEAMGQELGLTDLPPLYETEGGVTLGSGKAPSVKPRSKSNKVLDDIEAELDSLGKK